VPPLITTVALARFCPSSLVTTTPLSSVTAEPPAK